MDSSHRSDTPTLTRHLLETLMKRTDIEGAELVSLLVTIQSIVKNISSAVRRAGISRLFGAEGSINVQGEEQQKLDILANQVYDFLYPFDLIIFLTFSRSLSIS